VKSKPKKCTFIPDELYFCTILNPLTMNRRPGKHKNNINELVARYERMLNGDAQSFFDTHEFEDIADHYIDRGLLGEAMSSMEIAFEQ